jgi:hypothetical protein
MSRVKAPNNGMQAMLSVIFLAGGGIFLPEVAHFKFYRLCYITRENTVV